MKAKAQLGTFLKKFTIGKTESGKSATADDSVKTSK